MARLETVPYAHPEAARLRALMSAELDERYFDYPEDFGAPQRAVPEQFEAPTGTYLLVREDDASVGIGGVRTWEPGTGEIKNVFVVPERRGGGIAGRIMEALEAWARAAGMTRLVLETGERQPEALALYARLGFARIPAYPPWDDDLSICLAKAL